MHDTPAAARDDALAQCRGRSPGGLTTKLHALADPNGLLLMLKFTEGHAHDGRTAADRLACLGLDQILREARVYVSDPLRQTITAQGAVARNRPMP